MTGSRYVVTGGAGFIGRRVVERLLEVADNQVAVVDNLSAGLPMPPASARLRTFNVDIRDRDAVLEVMRSFAPTTLVHLAAVHHIPTCEKQRSYSLSVNVVGTEQILELAELGETEHVVLASSGAVYAWEDKALDEDTSPLGPSDNYSLAKYTNENQLRFWTHRTGRRAAIARIFNTIGHDDPNAHLVPDIISQVPQGANAVEIALGNVSPRRDYIHADDTARAVAMIAQRTAPPGVDIFNVASGRETSVAALVDMLGEVMGVTITVREDRARKRLVDRPSQLGATRKIESMLGFKPEKTLRLALEQIVLHARRPVVAG